jgi:hypothetical protein
MLPSVGAVFARSLRWSHRQIDFFDVGGGAGSRRTIRVDVGRYSVSWAWLGASGTLACGTLDKWGMSRVLGVLGRDGPTDVTVGVTATTVHRGSLGSSMVRQSGP